MSKSIALGLIGAGAVLLAILLTGCSLFQSSDGQPSDAETPTPTMAPTDTLTPEPTPATAEDGVGVASDRAALVALYNATEGGSWITRTNWLSGRPLDEWHGVTTDSDGRVTALNLSSNSLYGALPAALGGLSNLTGLWLQHNQLTGEIPPELGGLSNLTELSLDNNQLTGEIPPELGGLSNLTGLWLWSNQLTGEIPPELGGLSNLTELSLDNNQLTGEIPPELGGLSNLTRLWLHNNQLTGEIPPELGGLSNLEVLWLWGNQLTGEIPPELGGLSNLTELILDNNGLTGEIPAALGDLANLESLRLSDNQLTGGIPPELGGLSNLQSLWLRGNELTGCIPEGLRDIEANDLGDLDQQMIEAGCIDPDSVPDDYADVPDDHGNDIDSATVAAATLPLDVYLTLCALPELELADDATFGDLSSVLAAEADRLEALTPPVQLSEWHLLNIEAYRIAQAGVDTQPKDDVMVNNPTMNAVGADFVEKLREAAARVPKDVLQQMIEAGCIDPDVVGDDYADVPDGQGNDIDSATVAAATLSLDVYLTLCVTTELELADDATFGDFSSLFAAEADRLEALTPPAQLSEWHLLNIEGFLTIQAFVDLQPKDDVIDIARFLLMAAISADSEEKLRAAAARLPEDVLQQMIEAGCIDPEDVPDDHEDVPDDHGNDIDDATVAAVGADVEGALDYDDDIDYFRFQAEQGESYQIDVALGTLDDSIVELYDVDGSFLDSNDDYGDTLASRLYWNAPSSGERYVAVEGYGIGTYTLTVSLSDIIDDHANSEGDATAIRVGTDVRGAVDYDGDFDFFRFQAERGQSYQIDVALGTLDDSIVDLHDTDWSFLDTNDDYGDTYASRLYWEAPSSGERYVLVGGAYTSSQGTYTLTVSIVDDHGDTAEDGVGVASDRAALVALYNATEGGSWQTRTNWLSGRPLDEWHGVTTDSDGRVTALNLVSNSLVGALPAELGDLTNLRTLILWTNDELTGPIPAWLGDLTNLRWLILGGNGLTGEIPPELAGLSNLTSLDLRGNGLTGEIPPELASLSNLQRLYLNHNGLTGEIPPELASLSNLTELYLNDNRLTGEIPPELGRLSNLMELGLYANQLTGEIPPELGRLSNLMKLGLYANQLTGEIPPELGGLSNLTSLILNHNRLTGGIPPELGGLSNLDFLWLRVNQLTGCIPEGLRDIEANDLGDLNLPDCGLEGRPTASSFDSVSAGSVHTCGLRSDGSVVCWGNDEDGRATPPAATFVSISAGVNHTCGVRSDGSVACWGWDAHGRGTPPAGSFDSVSAGGAHTCGLRSDGSVACWGWDEYGRATPPAGSFVSVSAGGAHTCGLRSDGSVACWGDDFAGAATPPAGSFLSVSAGDGHTCGVRSDDSVACWGYNAAGQATPPAGSFVSVSAEWEHTCGVRSDGSVACWGLNSDGQATPPAGSFNSVSAGRYHTCGVRSDGSVACWGENDDGQATPPAAGSLSPTPRAAEPTPAPTPEPEPTTPTAAPTSTPTPEPTPAAATLSLDEYLMHCASPDLELADDSTFGDLSSKLAAEADRLEALRPPTQLSEWHLLSIESIRTIQAFVDLQPKDDVIDFIRFFLIAAISADSEEKLSEAAARLPEDVLQQMIEAGCTDPDGVPSGDADESDDHGDDIDDATAIRVGTDVPGVLDYVGDPDFFVFEAESGKFYEISVAGNLYDAGIDLFDSNKAHLESFGSRAVWKVEKAGQYYIEVTGGWGSAGSYTLSVSVLEITDDHGASAADASAVTVGESIEGAVNYLGDEDVFLFQVEAGTIYEIDVALGTLADSRLVVYDEPDEWKGRFYSPVLSVKTHRNVWRSEYTGDSYLVVGFPGSESGSYTIKVAKITLAGNTSYDSDDDGLIEVANLEQLDAIRWDLDGDGLPDSSSGMAGFATAFPGALDGMGCPDSGCSGYELISDLDFDTNGNGRADAGDAYWNDGEGWAPIGHDFEAAFETFFDGGGHTISNLYIDRRDAKYVGLFGNTGFSGSNVWVGLNNNIRDIALVNVDVQGGTYTGGLVGNNGLVIVACSVTGVVSGGGSVGGLVGDNFGGTIIASYSAASVADGSNTGGLIGSNFVGTIIASYSIGSVSDYDGVGGFVEVGGLVGSNFADRGTARDSYWDTQTSGQSESAGGEGRTTSELQSPTGYTGIYENWNVDLDEDGVGDDLWDFGNASQYPTLWHGT